MACKPLKSVFLDSGLAPAEILKLLNIEIDTLAEIAKDVNFDDPDDCQQFIRNVQYLKSYFEKYHTLIAP